MSDERGRWTYTEGSAAEGVVLYDEGPNGGSLKLHSFHDTDPARGQNNAFDVVRLHLFGWMDTAVDLALPITERPSYKSMVALANEQPEVRIERAQSDFEVLADEDDSAGRMEPNKSEDAGTPDAAELVPKATARCTDLANANRLQKAFGAKIFSCAQQFYFWTGAYWKPDNDEVFRCASKLSRLIRAEAGQLAAQLDANIKAGKIVLGSDADTEAQSIIKGVYGWAKKSEGLPTIKAALGLLLPLLSVEASKLNANPWLFNCRNGTIDLRSGELRSHAQADYLTICAPTVYDPAAQAPRFEQFLGEIFPSGADMIDFARRWFGYCVTGSVREQKLVIHVGPGGNGKGTLMEAITHVVGDYASTAPPGLILAGTGGDRHPTELADLMGRRMVTVAETENEAQLREGLVKQATGGDRIKARKMHKDFMEFFPTHKLQVFTNHEPNIKGQDYGMWRRLLLVNYPVRFGTEEDVVSGQAHRLRDTTLSLALMGEARGILAWLVAGAREWYTEGLQPPEAVLAAVKGYRFEQDRMAQFVAERCVLASVKRVPLDRVYRAYKGWVQDVGYMAIGRARFVKDLRRVVTGATIDTWVEQHGEASTKVTGFTGLDLVDAGYE